ncbi:MAG: hypothetical protein ACRDJF_09090 [Actinomycetota bacterium]
MTKTMGWFFTDPKAQAKHDDERVREALDQENEGPAQERKWVVTYNAEVATERREYQKATGKTYW